MPHAGNGQHSHQVTIRCVTVKLLCKLTDVCALGSLCEGDTPMAGSGQIAAAKSQSQPAGAKRRRTENYTADAGASAQLREKASAGALAKLKAARQVC